VFESDPRKNSAKRAEGDWKKIQATRVATQRNLGRNRKGGLWRPESGRSRRRWGGQKVHAQSGKNRAAVVPKIPLISRGVGGGGQPNVGEQNRNTGKPKDCRHQRKYISQGVGKKERMGRPNSRRGEGLKSAVSVILGGPGRNGGRNQDKEEGGPDVGHNVKNWVSLRKEKKSALRGTGDALDHHVGDM